MASKDQEENAILPAESAQTYLDRHPRPSRAGAVAEEAPSFAAVTEASAAEQSDCTPTRIRNTGSNGDEERFQGEYGQPTYIGNFRKGLPHDDLGEVDRKAYRSLLEALDKREGFDKIILGLGRKLTNPQGGLAADTEGPDPEKLHMLSAPCLDSAEEAAEAVELYWMALLRDVPFTRFDTDPGVGLAVEELSKLEDFTGPKVGGRVTPRTIFRGCPAGDNAGPYLSQFLLQDVGYGSLTISQKQKTVVREKSYLTSYDEWLNVQRGGVPAHKDAFDPTPRYIRNMRDLAQYVHVDALYEAYLNACLLLLDYGARPGPGNPYLPASPDSRTQISFGTFGGPHILSLVTEVATRALKAVWWQKWFVHRRLRPEEYGGLIHVKLEGMGGTKKDYPIHSQVLHSKALERVRSQFGSYLLPMAFPEGSPSHPAYGAGHAVVGGACATILKAWFDEDAPLPFTPKVANDDGSALMDYTGPGAGSLTVGGELDKVVGNIGIGRSMAGVHWRSDHTESIRLGEKVALSILDRQRKDYHEKGWSFTLRTFEGKKVTINRDGVFSEDGKALKL